MSEQNGISHLRLAVVIEIVVTALIQGPISKDIPKVSIERGHFRIGVGNVSCPDYHVSQSEVACSVTERQLSNVHACDAGRESLH